MLPGGNCPAAAEALCLSGCSPPLSTCEMSATVDLHPVFPKGSYQKKKAALFQFNIRHEAPVNVSYKNTKYFLTWMQPERHSASEETVAASRLFSELPERKKGQILGEEGFKLTF